MGGYPFQGQPSVLKGLLCGTKGGKPERIAVKPAFVLQIEHQPFLPVSFFRLAVDFSQFLAAFRQHGFKRLLFFLANNKHRCKLGFPWVDGAERFTGFFEFDIPAPLPAARAEFYFFPALESFPEFQTKFMEQGIANVFPNFFQYGRVVFIL